MIIQKFGGTSVGTASRIKKVANIIKDNKKKIIVLSAMAGTTNKLVEIASFLYKKDNKKANKAIGRLEKEYYNVVKLLYSSSEYLEKGNKLIKYHFAHLKTFTLDMFTLFEERTVLAQGELISSALFNFYLQEQNINPVLLPALNFMRIDKSEEPDLFYIKENLKREIHLNKDTNIFITQGFICRNAFGEIDNLKRGGSDYTASLIGAAIEAKEIQIWTDIDGMHNNDPRYVKNTQAISHLSFNEAAELAYFGAKILHPSSIFPAKIKNIPVSLKNTLNPVAKGTIISNKSISRGIKAIAAKDNITAIKIQSGKMLLAHGFLRKVFEIFEIYKTSIDMISTSEVAVSLTIDDNSNLENISNELKKYGEVEVDKHLCIICVVGDFIAESKGKAQKIFNALEKIPIRMISYGGSKHNISMVVKTSDKIETLKLLNKKLFENV